MKGTKKQIVFWGCLLSGLCLIYIGLRFFFDPMGASIDYGVNPQSTTDFSFEYIKSVRDFFFGTIILVLLWKKLWQALAWVLLIGTIVPLADLCIVVSRPGFRPEHTIAHLVAVALCLACGIYYLKNYKAINQKHT